MLQTHLHIKPEDFLARNRVFLEENPDENHILLSVLNCSNNIHGITICQGKETLVCGIVTPINLLISPHRGGLDEMAEFLLARYQTQVPGIYAAVKTADEFVVAWAKYSHQKPHRGNTLIFYKLENFIMPAPVPGVFRFASEQDIDLVAKWWHNFQERSYPLLNIHQ